MEKPYFATKKRRFSHYNEENGIYEFDGEFLIKQSEFNDYTKSFRHSVVTKLGTNVGKQFHLSRLLDGYYPNKSEPKEFLEKKNWMIRNKVDSGILYTIGHYLRDVISYKVQVIQGKYLES